MTNEPEQENVRYVPPGWHEMNAADPARVGTLCGAMLDGLNGAIDVIDSLSAAPAVTHVDSMMAGINALRIILEEWTDSFPGAPNPKERALLFLAASDSLRASFQWSLVRWAEEMGVEAPDILNREAFLDG